MVVSGTIPFENLDFSVTDQPNQLVASVKVMFRPPTWSKKNCFVAIISYHEESNSGGRKSSSFDIIPQLKVLALSLTHTAIELETTSLLYYYVLSHPPTCQERNQNPWLICLAVVAWLHWKI